MKNIWTLTFRRSGKTRTFDTLHEARAATRRAAAKHGIRWVSLRPKQTG